MVTTDADGSSHYTEFAVILPSGLRVGPMCQAEAAHLAAERGGTITRRQITHGPWHTLTEVNA